MVPLTAWIPYKSIRLLALWITSPATNLFQLGIFYNGLKPQLVTYLAALQELDETKNKPVFGAMYLHLQDPIIKLKDTKNLEQLVAANTSLVYKGTFLKEESLGLNHFIRLVTNSIRKMSL